jgi:hypothetical protein
VRKLSFGGTQRRRISLNHNGETHDKKWSFLGRGVRFAVLLLAPVMILAAADTGYHVIKRIPILGDSGWDYITADTAARRLYVPHGTEVVALDLDSGKIGGKITDLKGVHGVALAREFGHGFISATDPGSVTMLDLNSQAAHGSRNIFGAGCREIANHLE